MGTLVQATLKSPISFSGVGLHGGQPVRMTLHPASAEFGIWFRRTSMYAAGGIAIIMVGAVYYHLMHTPVAEAIPAFVVLICCGLIVNRRGTGIIG